MDGLDGVSGVWHNFQNGQRSGQDTVLGFVFNTYRLSRNILITNLD
jgi:hypothetical protein